MKLSDYKIERQHDEIYINEGAYAFELKKNHRKEGFIVIYLNDDNRISRVSYKYGDMPSTKIAKYYITNYESMEIFKVAERILRDNDIPVVACDRV